MTFTSQAFAVAMVATAVAAFMYMVLHRVMALLANRRRPPAGRRPGLLHVRPALARGPFAWMLRALTVVLLAGGVLGFCLSIAADTSAGGHAALAREWRIAGILFGSWAAAGMGVALWIPFRVERVLPLSLRAEPEGLQLRFVLGTRRIPWREVTLKRPGASPSLKQNTWLIARDVVLLLPGPFRPADEAPPSLLARLTLAHRSPMRLSAMPLHDDLVEALGEPVIASVPPLTMFRAMRLPLAVLIASMTLPVVAMVRMELVQQHDRGASEPAGTHP